MALRLFQHHLASRARPNSIRCWKKEEDKRYDSNFDANVVERGEQCEAQKRQTLCVLRWNPVIEHDEHRKQLSSDDQKVANECRDQLTIGANVFSELDNEILITFYNKVVRNFTYFN